MNILTTTIRRQPKSCNVDNETGKIPRLLVCVGAQKAGTTWLHSVLDKTNYFHTGYFKEVHYFDSIHDNTWYMNRRRAQQLKWYFEQMDVTSVCRWLNQDVAQDEQEAELFRKVDWCSSVATDQWYVDMMTPSDPSMWALDFSPGYATIGAEGFTHLASLVDRLQILFVLRNPIDRSWSSLIHEARFSIKGPVEPESLLEKSDDELFAALNRGNIARYSNYLSTLQALKHANLLDRVEVVVYEDTKSDAEQFVTNVLDLMNVADEVDVDGETVNRKEFASPKIQMPTQLRSMLTEHFSDQVLELKQEFNLDLSAWKDFG